MKEKTCNLCKTKGHLANMCRDDGVRRLRCYKCWKEGVNWKDPDRSSSQGRGVEQVLGPFPIGTSASLVSTPTPHLCASSECY